jgi:hypothetical protein
MTPETSKRTGQAAGPQTWRSVPPGEFELSRRNMLMLPAAGLLGAGTARAADSIDKLGSAFERVTLEVSLKPFRVMEEKAIRAVCVHIFRQWASLIHRCDSVAIMLWTADGSEIFEYSGRMDDEIEWARYIGMANPPAKPAADDPNREGTHARNWLYMDNPPKITYGWLKSIVATLKSAGREMTGKPITVGATFDPGGEFARSPFKFERHAEISTGNTMGPGTWVACTARLKADSRAYAGFPNGIPDNTPVGAFLGRQSRHFLKDLGFDYIWFSNGFGFSLSPWRVTGPLFDGKSFDAARAPAIRDEILSFWRTFRKECPDFPIETRGSNLIAGADMATGASPLKELYDGGFNMMTPPNSPWAAIDGDFGLEIAGYLSRIAHLPPHGKFPFRFYTHDPWWLNSPWLDRYGREPHDIYLPLAVTRIDGDARITRPSYLEFLTIDDTLGRLPDQVPNEVTPHLLSAMDHFPDAPGPVTLIYPLSEFREMVFGKQPRQGEVFFSDWFLRGAVNQGFPLNTVVSSENFMATWRKAPGLYRETVLLSPVPPAGSPLEATLLDCIRQGRDVLLFGPLTHASGGLLRLLNLRVAGPLTGDLEIRTDLDGDVVRNGAVPSTLRHRDVPSGGGIDTVVADPRISSAKVCARAVQGGEERVYAMLCGRLAWVRGSFCCTITSANLPQPDDPAKWFLAESLMRRVLAEFGFRIRVEKPAVETRTPLVLASRHRNGFYFSGYSPSTTTTLRLKFPHGAPLLVGAETWLDNGFSVYTMPRAWHREARCFVEQSASSELSCVEIYPGHPGIRRRLRVSGLKNATVHFYPEDRGRVIIAANDMRLHNATSSPHDVEDDGRRLVARNVTGQLLISW